MPTISSKVLRAMCLVAAGTTQTIHYPHQLCLHYPIRRNGSELETEGDDLRIPKRVLTPIFCPLSGQWQESYVKWGKMV